ncbi:restriction endonuclease-like protein [Denitrificimonas sp. JX-1]|uniref:Restriction endonuclease-like protein n=1 Tax=Denitrificimonas halotolerans TaxID=3098930 RepID=A0ABU5GSN1_9GAMM|nr:restriction endonuclease-like protein [Denitrificimonas sp. JX-1]MDY7219360.1 restriction endonuclease-like protein [Denitrificimonas sp. JX-1]
MAELLRLKTDEFLFTVKAASVESRSRTLSKTLLIRQCTNSNILVKVTPAIKLSEQPRGFVDGPCSFLHAVEDLNHTDQVNLDSPIFFENTLYQVEWIFLKNVQWASLNHRSKTVCDAFIFTPSEDGLSARLTGTINTGNDVGWLRLPLTFELNGKTQTQHIAFEVLPTKMALHQDLPAMYQAIDKVYPLWRFSLVEKTEQDAATNQQRGHFPLIWLANFAALRERFEQGLKVICAAPHSRLQPTVANIKAAKLKGRLSHKLAEQVKQDFANGQYDKRYAVEKKQLSVDTPENRFIKMAVSKSKRQLAEFEQKLRQSNQAPERQRLSDSFLNELHSWQQPLQKVLGQSFLKEVGAYTGLSRESLVLQQKTGYSAVYRVWQELKFYLDVFGNQSSISMKSVAEIYEVWCFLCLKQILEQDLGFELVENSATKLAQNDFFEYQLKDGFAGAFRFKRSDGVTARLAHEPKFTKKGKSIRSYLVNQEPDIVLEVTLPKSASSDLGSSEEKQFIWLFDAKYRIKTDKNRFDDSNEDIESTDYVPDDAINQMHRYRDALIRLSESSSSSMSGQFAKKSRPVFGAFALYPGFFDQATKQNPYASAIEEVGIGAFALLPSQSGCDKQSGYSGRKWLLEFLQDQIGTAPSTQIGQGHEAMYSVISMAERFYVQEAARIPYYGMSQVLYPDLTMTVALGKYNERFSHCFEQFKNGVLRFYHLPVSTFQLRFKAHVINEVRYLVLIPNHQTSDDISAVWLVRNVQYLKRSEIDVSITGKESDSNELYVLFELGQPFSLKNPVVFLPDGTFRHSIRLTTLSRLESVVRMADVEEVYEEVMVSKVQQSSIK